MVYEPRIVIGLKEKVVVQGNNGLRKRLVARIDTGATKSSIDQKVAQELNLGPVLKNKVFKSAHGDRVRPLVKVRIRFIRKTIKCYFSVVDRSHMRYKLLIGQNVLKRGFLIDPCKK
jgi:hypothetical protein